MDAGSVSDAIDLTEYLATYYGSCRQDRCTCLHRNMWLGRTCQNWQPTTAKTWEELSRWQFETIAKTANR